ncbi:S8 family serine peptidase [Siphonobacter sp. SORGH_AS_0500]|uniref:S8 family peptidase n=1 Tax=Siphonobacter sp. SORGH_AS_0500 TaxID=1864824 RepID=UPI0028565599|nr:S8 family serine peptidase [Siphonobacter sp. SORGH_AS_0500]MDR6193826.1 subtilisin family serine protease [Siphonobacter sp. SORGH_AS_0500]
MKHYSPDGPERPSSHSENFPKRLAPSPTFRSRKQIKTFLGNERNYPHVTEVSSGTGFAVRNQLLIQLDYLEFPADSSNEYKIIKGRTALLEFFNNATQPGAPQPFLLDGNGKKIILQSVEECLCLNDTTFLLKGEGLHECLEIKAAGEEPPGRHTTQPPIRASLNYIIPSAWVNEDSLEVEPLERWNDYAKDWSQIQAKTDGLVVAILDTGIEDNPRYPLPFWYKKFEDPCRRQHELEQIGWNFSTLESESGNQPTDDNVLRHGSKIAHIIHYLAPGNAALMILKTFDHYGFGSLDKVFCALQYAMDNGARIVNASFGYYGNEIPLLRDLLEQMNERKILVAAAAGNHTDFDGFPNDISVQRLYPACYSLELDNVVTVTTLTCEPKEECDCQESKSERLLNSITKVIDKALDIKGHERLPYENYSSSFVNLGIETQDGSFRNLYPIQTPGYQEPASIQGSSYATPVFVGIAARYFLDIQRAIQQSPNEPLKKIYFSVLQQKGVIRKDQSLRQYVRGGFYMLSY